MIECIFTIDYEIYGNGKGSLKKLIYEPAEKLSSIFAKWNAPMVVFVEAAELEMIDAKRSDAAIDLVKKQVRKLKKQGFEIGLHLHPQWYKGNYSNNVWLLDYNEYNLCILSEERIFHILDQSIDYLRYLVCDPNFTPISFRAGNWLFQPSKTASEILAEKGIKIDSSVFKGGLQRNHGLDYRSAVKNGYYWRFKSDVTKPDVEGSLIEIPIHTSMVPFWKMLTLKRIGIQKKSFNSKHSITHKLNRILDYMRPKYPMKFDFCRMSSRELTSMLDRVIENDRKTPTTYKPLVAIGHTKDLVDFESIELFLAYLEKNKIPVSTFEKAYQVHIKNNTKKSKNNIA